MKQENKQFVPNNDRFKILNDTGFSDFVGVTRSNGSFDTIKLISENSSCITTPDHVIFCDVGMSKPAKNFRVSDSILTENGIEVIIDKEYHVTKSVYDVLQVENGHRFYSACESSKYMILKNNCILMDEMAFVPNAEEFYESVYPTISSGADTKVIITSTPKGLNFFYKMWVEAETGRSEYVAYDVKWYEHPQRDQEWYNTQAKNLNGKSLDQEINCVSGSTVIKTEYGDMTMKDLYDNYKKLNSINNNASPIVYFNGIIDES